MGTDDRSLSGIAELHAVARRMGHKRAWFQNRPGHPHYDVTESKRPAAIAAGAVEVDHRTYVDRCSDSDVRRAARRSK
jgi:hypothetical protein